jgi:ribulose-5-phosphate 4-epimerase/fuculose-1-phosphate aldolase
MSSKHLVVQACRILAMEGLVEGILGHVSVRAGDDRMLIRCRGEAEHGLLFTEDADVRLTDFDGTLLDPDEGYKVPNELPIHGELLRTRPEVNAVVHAHPPEVLICGVAGLELRPIVGSYNMPAMRMALDGVPVYPRSVLIRRPELAHEMIAAMGDKPVCVLKGHGITVTGDSVEQAVVRAINLNALAAVTLAVAQAGGKAEPIPTEDIAELPDLGSAFNDLAVWRYYVAKAQLQESVKPQFRPRF